MTSTKYEIDIDMDTPELVKFYRENFGDLDLNAVNEGRRYLNDFYDEHLTLREKAIISMMHCDGKLDDFYAAQETADRLREKRIKYWQRVSNEKGIPISENPARLHNLDDDDRPRLYYPE